MKIIFCDEEKELLKEKDWITVDLNSTQDLLEDFAMRLVDECRNFSDILKKYLCKAALDTVNQLKAVNAFGNTKVQLFSKVRKLCELFLPFI